MIMYVCMDGLCSFHIVSLYEKYLVTAEKRLHLFGHIYFHYVHSKACALIIYVYYDIIKILQKPPIWYCRVKKNFLPQRKFCFLLQNKTQHIRYVYVIYKSICLKAYEESCSCCCCC